MSVNLRSDIMALPSRTGGEVDRFLSEKGYDAHKEVLYPHDRILTGQMIAVMITAVGVSTLFTFGITHPNPYHDISRNLLIVGSTFSAAGVIPFIAFSALRYHKRKEANEKILSETEVDDILKHTHARVMRQVKYARRMTKSYSQETAQFEQKAKDLGLTTR